MGLAWQQGPLAPGAIGRFYPVAYFPLSDITEGVLEPDDHATRHQDLGPTSWYNVRAGEIDVHLDGTRLRLEPGQAVVPHGVDRDLTTDEVSPGRA